MSIFVDKLSLKLFSTFIVKPLPEKAVIAAVAAPITVGKPENPLNKESRISNIFVPPSTPNLIKSLLIIVFDNDCYVA